MSASIHVAILGGSGYGAGELLRLLIDLCLFRNDRSAASS